MRIDLFKSFEGVHYFANIPQSFGMDDSIVESKRYSYDAPWGIISDFALLVDDPCDVLLDIGDVDFFNVSQCKKLLEVLDTISYPEFKEMSEFISDLKVAAKRAIELGTGIVVEL